MPEQWTKSLKRAGTPMEKTPDARGEWPHEESAGEAVSRLCRESHKKEEKEGEVR